MSSSRRFRYQLESVLRKRESDSEELRHKQAEVRMRLDGCTRALEEVQNSMDQTETQLRGSNRQGAAIDPSEQTRLQTYLKMLRADHAEKKKKLEAVQTEYDDVCAEVRTAQKEIKTLEKHREGRRTEFDTHWNRKDQSAADELWLLRKSNKR